ncbi:hypothetical protein AB6A40_008287 [Gnathostoma spinigerum]|uniref:Vacuolar protein sorting-associated protein 13 VPS13 adaptor binding domain-containing protein n=1 Tax=Gnathostoma spinigerum TaxID=75299 RepID=A0ABD6ENN3_9BILA
MGRKSKEFVGIRYEQSSKNDKIINFSSSPFFLCLCPEFLGSLSSFFAVPQAIEDDASAIEGTTKAAAPIVPSKATKVSPSAPSGTLTMNCKLRETEVILVENADHPESTQALILSFNVDVEGSQEGEKKVMKGGLKNLQMVSTYYATEKRSYSHYQVLNKVDFSFTGVIDDKTRSQHFVVDIAPMHLKVSPSIIRLLSAVSASFSAANKPVEVSEATHKGMLKKYPNYWQIRKIDRAKYWWFDVAEEEDYCEPAIDVVAGLDHVEEAVIKLCSLIITLEAGKDDDTKPMILVESSFYGTASDWTSLLSMDAAMTLQVSYYNETFSVWEPVVEPVEVEDGLWQPWRLGMKLLSHGEDEEGEGGFPSPHQTISIQATDMLNVTVTKSFLQLLNRLSDSFAQAAKLISPPKSRTLPGSSPYLILNNTGVSVKVANSDTLRVSDSENDVIDATASTFVDLNVKFDRKEEIGLVQNQFAQKGDLRLIFDDMNTEREVNVVRAEIRTVSLPRTAENGKQWKLVVETKIENSRRLVILRSPVQFINHTDIPYEIHSIRDTTLDLCGIVGPGSEPLDVPLALLYSPSGGLYIRPADDSFETSNESVIWYDFETKKRHILRCDLSADTKMGVYAALIIEEFTVKSEKHRSLTDRIFVVHIYPPVTLQNFLPFLVRIKSPLEKELAGGDEVALNVIPGHKIQFEMEYRGKAYFAEMPVGSENHDLEMVSLHCGDKEMNIGVHWSIEHRRLEAQLYAPYWFVNNTGMQLTYEESSSTMLSKSASCVSCRKGNISDKVSSFYICAFLIFSWFPNVLLLTASESQLRNVKIIQ